MRSFVVLHALCLAVALSPRVVTSASAAVAYPDSTIVDRFTLPNGLKVVARHVPQASAVVITLCFQGGSADDPAGREGLSNLLADVAFTAEAGDVPARTTAEMSSQRPMGFGVRVLPRITQLTEIAAYRQFPGVLRQVCQRLKGVTIDDDALRRATADVKRELADSYGTRTERLLFHGTAHLAGANGFSPQRFASGQGLDRLTVGEIQRLVSQRFVPANAVMAVVGNLLAYDVRRMIERELADARGGTAPPPIVWGRDSASVVIDLPNVAEPAGVIGIIAPALTDTLHPAFFAHAVILGSYLHASWGPAAPPLTTRFQYSIGDDPELARYYPPITFSEPPRVDEEFAYGVQQFEQGAGDSVTFDRMALGVAWLLGGPVPRDLLIRMKRDPAALSTLASSMAARERYADESFWLEYRSRFGRRLGPALDFWTGYFNHRGHQVQMVVTPPRR